MSISSKKKNLILSSALLFAFASACTKKSEPPPETGPASQPAAEGAEKPAAAKPEAVKPETAKPAGGLEIAKDLPPIPASESWRAEKPKGDAAKPLVLPAFKTAKLKNGLTVLVPAEKALLPVVSFQLVTKGGAALDAPEKAGVVNLVYGMLGEGAGKRDALQFSDAAADLGAQFGAAPDRDRGAASIGGLKRNADGMLALLADAALRPRMLAKDFDRRKGQQVATLIATRGSPQGLAFEVVPSLIYGPAHPYGHPSTGTPETVQKITLEDIKASLPRAIAPERSALIAAGDITLEEATKLAEKHFGKWTSKAEPMPEIAAVEAGERREIVVVNKANSPQTMVVVGRPIFGRGHPDEPAMTVTNAVYGGAFSSRLNMNLREDKGYTYGAGSQSSYRIGAGAFMAFSAIRQDVTAPGLAEFFKELDGLKTRPAQADEVDLAKSGLILALPGQFERASAAAGAAASIFVYDLPLDYYTQLVPKLEAVGPAKVKEIAEKHLDPKRMTILLVGEAEKIKPGVEKLGLGAVTVRDKP